MRLRARRCRRRGDAGLCLALLMVRGNAAGNAGLHLALKRVRGDTSDARALPRGGCGGLLGGMLVAVIWRWWARAPLLRMACSVRCLVDVYLFVQGVRYSRAAKDEQTTTDY